MLTPAEVTGVTLCYVISGSVITVGLRLGLGLWIVEYKLLEKVTKGGSIT